MNGHGHASVHYLLPTTEEVYVYVRMPEFGCLSVCICARLFKKAWIWMKCCVSTDVGTRKNLLTFEPDPDIVRMPEPDSFLPLQRGNVEFYYVGKIPCTYWYWGKVEAATRGLRRRKTVVGGKCALPSAHV